MWNYNIPYQVRINKSKNDSFDKLKSLNISTISIWSIIKSINLKYYNIKRYLFLSFGIYLLYKLIAPYSYEYRTLLLLIFIEFVAIMLSSLSLFLFTHINFINDYKIITTNETKPQNNKVSQNKSNENKTAFYILLGFIFLSVHLCVGFSILGIYITQITN